MLITMNRRITIEEVARAAGVSTATVSRVLSKPGVVRSTTKEGVMTAVRQLDTTPMPLPAPWHQGVPTLWVASYLH